MRTGGEYKEGKKMRKFRYIWGGLLLIAILLWLFGYRGEKAFMLGAAGTLLLMATEVLLKAHAMDIELARQVRGEIKEARFGKSTIHFLSVVGALIGALGVIALVIAILFVIIF